MRRWNRVVLLPCSTASLAVLYGSSNNNNHLYGGNFFIKDMVFKKDLMITVARLGFKLSTFFRTRRRSFLSVLQQVKAVSMFSSFSLKTLFVVNSRLFAIHLWGRGPWSMFLEIVCTQLWVKAQGLNWWYNTAYYCFLSAPWCFAFETKYS